MRHYILVHLRQVIDIMDELEGPVYVAHAGTMKHGKSNTWPTPANIFQLRLAIFLQHLLPISGLLHEAKPTNYA